MRTELGRYAIWQRRLFPIGWLLATGLLCVLTAGAAPLEKLRDSVKEFTLKNGLHFIVVEKHDAPVFSFSTCVDAGGVCEVPGITGIAHMFEHMAFKGTKSIGTSDYRAELKAMAKTDAAWDAVTAERNKRFAADSTRLEGLETEFRRLVEEEAEFVLPNDYTRIIETEGARDLNAFTSTDMTCYFYSLPSNRTELWARMEGDRMTNPVLREFYKERDVVRNERRIGTESTPVGRLFEDILQTSFVAHPYGNGVIGHSSDIENFHRRDAWAFFDKHYVAKNMTIAVVGDITVEQVAKLAKKYFSDVSLGPDPAPIKTVEPVHRAEHRVIYEDDANSVLLIGWQCPASAHPDYAEIELLMEILGQGRSSRLNEALVKEEQILTQVQTGTGLPGQKYANLAVVFGFLAADRDPFEAEELVYEEIEYLIAEGPDEEEVEKVKAAYLARTMRQLRTPTQLALNLAITDQMEGDWRNLFTHLGDIEAVTAADIQRVASEYLTKERRTVGILKKTVAEDVEG